MATLQEKIEQVRREFDRTPKPTAKQLIAYPQDSLGQLLGYYLLNANHGQNVYADNEDVLHLLIAEESSIKEDFALYFYLFGNGCNSLRTWATMGIAMAVCPIYLPYFYKRYRQGKNALRFYDIDHLGLLYQPVEKVKQAFMII
ncbi:hypothetical protein AM493_08020 [Flavobacterium akiainvivens]|uniref:Uncharacterized protein n=1 Tax=Flavobacterium akiainvivens TaxID=1202724 RepID=A0A0M8MI11_9FLAO|nr:hypothetical protein [Flavobacterium akiainvivens]KOS05988.1 hypothetical protein AM493_08020 [Flavobacterium akiainvivens]SFQ53966.1 hypothetical protein SAMN05444144_10785 [Flavobacterium akiainvivens]